MRRELSSCSAAGGGGVNLRSILKQGIARNFCERQSSLRALRSFMGEEKFRCAVLDCPDRRELFAVSAEHLSMDESLLVTTIANRMDLRVAEVLSIPEAEIALNSCELRRAACFPGVENGGVSFLCCVDPAFAPGILRTLGPLPVRLGRWQDIRRALDNLDLNLSKRLQAAENLGAECRRKLAARILGSLATQALAYSRHSLLINKGCAELFYEIQAKNGDVARGSVLSAGCDALLFLLEELLLSGASISVDLGSQALVIKVERVGSSQYRVSWEEQHCETAQINLLLPDADSTKVRNPACRSRILIVDDNATFLHVLDRFLARYEFEVARAADGRTAMQILQDGNEAVDLVISDVHMPGIDGCEFLRQLRKQPQFDLLPVVMLTSDSDIELKVKLIETGADAVLTKNEDPRLLCTHVRRLIGKRRVDEAA